MIPFNRPGLTGNEAAYIQNAIEIGKLSGDGPYTKKCSEWFEQHHSSRKSLLTTSCTHALEMAAILVNIKAGDEVIMPSYTFVSTANAFVLRGATIVFVDVRPDTMNIDETKIEAAITDKTKAIVPVHYAGVSCEMDTIMAIASKYSLYVIEDAAQGMMSTYKGRKLGTIGHLGCFSFHETKNYQCGEGGALFVNDPVFFERAEIIREKGTNRSRFFRGQVDKYSWVDVGSSYLPSELNAAFLYAQLEQAEVINEYRLDCWKAYYRLLQPLATQGLIELPTVPAHCEHNAHMFYIKTADLDIRSKLIEYLKDLNIHAVFHYIPLHSSEAGVQCGYFHGQDRYTSVESDRLVRLPMFYGLELSQIEQVTKAVHAFYTEGE